MGFITHRAFQLLHELGSINKIVKLGAACIHHIIAMPFPIDFTVVQK
jgi:hypothetical protein